MNPRSLSNKQLYNVLQNKNLDLQLRHIAVQEFKNRGVAGCEMEELVLQHSLRLKIEKEPLKTWYKLLVIVFPLMIPVQSFFAARWLGQGYKRKWKEYWLCVLAGYFLWTILFVALSRLYFIYYMEKG